MKQEFSRMRCLSPVLIAVLCGAFFSTVLGAEAPPSAAALNGKVEGSHYINDFFGFSYKVPEDWTVRAVGGRLPGVPGHLLLFLKPKGGAEQLSTMIVSAAELPASYNGDLVEYLLDRYRLNQSENSSVTFNGIPASRIAGRIKIPQAEPVTFGERYFYRLDFGSPATARTVIATLDKGYALVFELVSPRSLAERRSTEFVDSLYSLNFEKQVDGSK